MLEYRANVLHEHHGWDVIVLCLAKHKRGSSLYTYGTPGVGLNFVGSKKEKASKAGHLCLNLFKNFAKQHSGGSGDQEKATSRTIQTDTVNSQDLVDEAGHFNSMEVECDADAEISETLDEVELDDTCAGGSNHEESLNVLTTGGAGRVAAVGCGSGKSTSGDGVTESGVGNVGRGRRSVGTVSQKDVNDSIQVAAAAAPSGEGTVGKHTVKSVQDGDQPRVIAEGTDIQVVQLHRGQPVEQVQEGAIGCMTRVDGGKQGVTVSSSHHALPGDGVAYLVNGQIKAVGKVDHDRTTLHGRKIGKGFACVQLYYVQSEDIVAPLILGDRDENSFLKTGMFFALPISKLFTLGKLVPGEKIVLHSYSQYRLNSSQ